MRLNVLSIAVVFFVIVFASMACYRDPSYGTPRQQSVAADALNINTATAEELMTIPNVGEKLAQRIVEFRESNGRFQRPEDLLLVPGISDKRFREIRNMIRTE